jgi:N-acyl-phosphatidylethanolamine-hydrolysing phospholipase D
MRARYHAALRVALGVALIGVLMTNSRKSEAGAPRDGGRFVNLAGPRPLPGFDDMFPFLLRKAWTSLAHRAGAAHLVAYDPSALAKNPSVTWIGHATLLVRMDGVTFLTDPVFSERASPVSFAGPERLVAPGVPFAALPPIDFVTISHDHYDHADYASIQALAARGIPFFVPLGLGALVREAGGQVTELDWWQSARIGRVEVNCVPAQHFAGRSLTDGNRRLWAGFVVVGPTRRFYHAGDTGYFDGFHTIGARLGPIDLAALPIGAYAPASIMQFVHMNPEEAIQAALDVQATTAMAMHYGTFDLTDEPLDEPPRRFHAEATRRALDPVTAWTLDGGETRDW